MSAPRVYAAIAAVTAELARSGIAKTQLNAAERYAYRGIDEVCNRLAPLLAQHRLCILPRVLERTCMQGSGSDGAVLTRAALHVAFDLVSARDGSLHTIAVYGEALDASDKATAKAMSAAYKQAVLQAFCIPIAGADDPDATTPRLTPPNRDVPDPDQGWEQWGRDMAEMIRVCEAGEALDRVQATYRAQLRAASKRQPELYAAIGAAMQARRQSLVPKPIPAAAKMAHVVSSANDPALPAGAAKASTPAKAAAHA